jgi:hypothetical protein
LRSNARAVRRVTTQAAPAAEACKKVRRVKGCVFFIKIKP